MRVEKRERKIANRFIEETRREDLKLLEIEKSRFTRAVAENHEAARKYQRKLHEIEVLFREVATINLSKIKIEHHATSLFQELNRMRDVAESLTRQLEKKKVVAIK